MGTQVLRTDAPAELAGSLLADALGGLIAARGFARLAISGGPGSEAVGRARRALGERGEAWRRVLLTWATQAAVPDADPASERGEAYRRGYLTPDDPPGFELPLWLDGDTPPTALARVTEGLAGPFEGGLDVCLLELGPDGSLAALHPGRPILSGPVAFVSDLPGSSTPRMTLTASTLATAAGSVVLALGPGMDAILDRVLEEHPAFPTSALSGLLIVTDRGPHR